MTKEKIVVLNILILELAKENIAVCCTAIDSTFDLLYMSYTFTLYADRPRFCLLSRGEWMNPGRELNKTMGELLETPLKRIWFNDKSIAQKKAAPIRDRIKNNKNELRIESVKLNGIISKRKSQVNSMWGGFSKTPQKAAGGVAGSSSSLTSLDKKLPPRLNKQSKKQL